MRRSSLMLFALVSTLLAVGCKADKDDDGYKEDVDCDETNDLVNPGATEICDGIDNDCDGEIDEGVTSTFYPDADGDGWGDESDPVEACSAASGMVEEGGDCDDTNPDVHPGAAETDCTDPVDYNCDGSVGYADADGDGAPACEDCDDSDASRSPDADEVCDGVDNDCDGVVDDEAVDAPTWYLDHDQDGYGDPDISVVECEALSDYWVDNAEDCNDLSADAYPGATEVCDELDNDCDGLVDVDDPDITDAVTLYVDADGDGFGVDGTDTLACAGSSGYVDIAGDCDDADDAVNPSADETCNDGVDDDCDGVADPCTMDLGSADVILYGDDADDSAGVALTGVGDINADGFDDFMVGADNHDADGDGSGEGSAYLVYGPVTAGTDAVGNVGVVIAGVVADDQAGKRLGGPGDMDGDGLPDLLVGAPQYDGGGKTNTGAVFLFSGASVGSVDLTLDDADASWYGDTNYDWIATSIAPLGDVDGDGLADVAVGSAGEDVGGSNSGAIFVISGEDGLSGSGSISSSAVRYGQKDEYIGSVVAGPGDLDGDGTPDMVVGFKTDSDAGTNAGAFYVIAGPITGSASIADDATAKVVGSSAGDYLGDSVTGYEDVNGDGYADLLVSATTEDSGAADAGAVYLFYGSVSLAALDGSDIDAVAGAKVVGDSKEQRFGKALDATGDNDGDGSNDLLVGSTSAGDSGRGRAWLFYGPISGTVSAADAAATFDGTYNDDAAGSAVAFLGDLDGSGRDAIGVAAVDGSVGGTNAGAAYLVFGIDY